MSRFSSDGSAQVFQAAQLVRCETGLLETPSVERAVLVGVEEERTEPVELQSADFLGGQELGPLELALVARLGRVAATPQG